MANVTAANAIRASFVRGVLVRCHIFSQADRIRSDETLFRETDGKTKRHEDGKVGGGGERRSESRMSREDGKGPGVTARAGFLRRYPYVYGCACARMCVYTVYTVWFRDALSNVLFISVEQSLPVYPEDISLVVQCTQRYTSSASQSRELHLKRRLSAVATRPQRAARACPLHIYALVIGIPRLYAETRKKI